MCADYVRENGNTVLYDPRDGSKFLMPPGGNPEIYILKGFTAADPSMIADGMWKGKQCFIIGGGPSLKGFDFSSLDGELTIGINRAVEFFNPTILFWMDSRFYEWITSGQLGEEAQKRFENFPGIKCALNPLGVTYPDGIVDIPAYVSPAKLSGRLRHGLGHGDNSGVAALNLALTLEASEIYMLGFDCVIENGRKKQQHFHGGYPLSARQAAHNRVKMAFSSIASEANDKARIINCNPESGITCFPFGEIPKRLTAYYQWLGKSGMGIPKLRPDMWKDQPAYIVGGGPSLKRFDFSQLEDRLTIGINRAFEKFDPSIIFSIDNRFYDWVQQGAFGADVRRKFSEFAGPKVWVDCRGAREFLPDIEVLAGIRDAGGLSKLLGAIHFGENSGYAAMQVAYLLGANPIYLLGFDMKGDGKGNQRHFHEGYPQAEPESRYAETFMPYFDQVAPMLAAQGVKVINLNPDSALQCFEFGDVDAALSSPPVRPLVIGYYTKGTSYEYEAQRMIHSITRFGFQHDIRGIDTLGGWQANTYYKARFLRKMIHEYPDRPLLFLDVDVEMKQYPAIFDHMEPGETGVSRYSCDMAVSIVDWSQYSTHSRDDKELNTSVIFLRKTPEVLELLNRWIRINELKEATGIWEQQNLQDALAVTENLTPEVLPDSYCQIFDLMESNGEPVIELHQASRTLKAEVGA